MTMAAACEGKVNNVVEVSGVCVGCGDMTIHQPTNKPAPAQVVRKGEEFSVKVEVGHTEILGDLETEYTANLYCHNIATGGTEASYSKTGETGKLEIDKTKKKFEFTFNAQAVGVFRHYFCIAFPHSDLATFIHGPVFFVFEP
jgi:hypothetical protein